MTYLGGRGGRGALLSSGGVTGRVFVKSSFGLPSLNNGGRECKPALPANELVVIDLGSWKNDCGSALFLIGRGSAQ